MTFLNQFHKEVTERKMRKIAASQQSPRIAGTVLLIIFKIDKAKWKCKRNK